MPKMRIVNGEWEQVPEPQWTYEMIYNHPLFSQLQGKKVLIADDAFFIRYVMNSILTSLGLTVVAEAVSWSSAVKKCNESKPDIIIIDRFMPEDGIKPEEVLDLIKSNFPEAKIGVLTSQRDMNLKKIKDIVSKYNLYIFDAKPDFDSYKIFQTICSMFEKENSV